MEFLVQIRVDLPAEMEAEERLQLRGAELKRGKELVANGTIKAIWRVPGGIRNVGIWEAEDATALQAQLESLPLYPWLGADVTPLGVHPLNETDSA